MSVPNVPPVTLTTAGLGLDELYRVAVHGARLRIADDVLALVRAGRAVVERMLNDDVAVYGLNTGLGHLRDRPLDRAELTSYQYAIIREHAGGVGEPLPDHVVRAIMLARIAGLARGGSGIHPGAFETLVALLNADVHPIVPAIGSVGASDLMHMAAIAQVVIGEGWARLDGETLPGDEALRRAGIAPYVPQPKDGLALISANGASIGLAGLAVVKAERIARLADLADALSLEAIAGSPGPYAAEVAAAKPIQGQIAAAAHLRDLLDGSYLHELETPGSLQDPLSFRVVPQVHGALRESIAACRRAVETELNAIDDNPLVSIAEGRLLSNGNFHPMALAIAFESLRVSLAHAGLICERRIHKIREQSFGYSTPVALYGRDAAGSQPAAPRAHVSGLLAYSAAALLAQLKLLAAPASLECPPLDLDVEDHATLAMLAVTMSQDAMRLLEQLLAIEVIRAVDKLLDVPGTPRLGAGTTVAFNAVRRILEQMQGHSQADLVEAVQRSLRHGDRDDPEA